MESIGVQRQVGKAESRAKRPNAKSWLLRHGEGTTAGASGVLIVIAWALQHFSSILSICLYLLAFIVGGFVKAKEGVETLLKERDLDVNLLMIVAAIGAACIGYWAEGAVLIFIFATSGALETYATARSSRDISKLMDLKPETGILYRNGQETVVPIEELRIGDIIIVKPGERIPADGMVTEGTSSVNQASITGESMPVDKGIGDEVFAGTLNGQGALFVEVTQSMESTLFSKIIKLVQEAQHEMPKSQLFVERFERIYAKVIILVTLIMMVVPHYLFHWNWSDTLYRAMVFLVVASPCALVASIMPAMLSAISNSARKGLLLKGGAHLENLSRVKVIAFDKTGTLTQGKLFVTDIVPLQSYTETEILQAVASLESLSTHPIAKAIVEKAIDQQIHVEHPTDFQSLTGWGIQATYRGEKWRIGKPRLMEESVINAEVTQRFHELEAQGKTVVMVQNSHGIAGIFALQDRIRDQTKRAIQQLHELGIKVAMLTGDQKETAKAIAQETGIDLVFSELLPDEKLHIVKKLKEEYGTIAMVGDGVNDAPALATATVGIAMGVAGSDAALETADLVLMNDDLERIKDAILIGRRMKSIVQQNMIFAITVIISLILSNFIKGIPLPLGVVGHEGSTILVILNGLRLLR
jgi:Zn2+/Cd2+-exporting ATPase